MSEHDQNGAGERHHAEQTTGADKPAWKKPELRRMKAGSAEVGTRATGDGAFTTS